MLILRPDDTVEPHFALIEMKRLVSLGHAF